MLTHRAESLPGRCTPRGSSLHAEKSPRPLPGPGRLKRMFGLHGKDDPAPGTPAKDARDFSKFLQDQGASNGCGTTSLASLLSYWRDQPGLYTRPMVDSVIRHFEMWTSPLNVLDYARRQGMRAEGKNHASLADLRRYLDFGVPVQVVIDPGADGSDMALHYVNVVDYQTDATGAIRSLRVADPAGGYMRDMDAKEFQDSWQNLKLKGASTGLGNVMIVVLPGQNTPISGRDGQVRQSSDVPLPTSPHWGWRARVGELISDGANLAGRCYQWFAGFFRSKS